LSFLLLLLLSPSFPQWFFFFGTRVWNVTRVFVSPPTCTEWSERKTTLTAVATAWNTPAVLSSYFLSHLPSLSCFRSRFCFYCLFFSCVLCVCFYFEKRPRLLLNARRQTQQQSLVWLDRFLP
jgi:hypothetical protein